MTFKADGDFFSGLQLFVFVFGNELVLSEVPVAVCLHGFKRFCIPAISNHNSGSESKKIRSVCPLFPVLSNRVVAATIHKRKCFSCQLFKRFLKRRALPGLNVSAP